MVHSRKLIALILLCLTIGWVIIGCTPPGPDQPPTQAPTATFEALPTAPLEIEPLPSPMPLCHPDLLVSVVLESPVGGEVLDLAVPTLQWMDPNSCNFEGYQIHLEYSRAEYNFESVNFYDQVDYPSDSYTLTNWMHLPPGTHVTWQARPILHQQQGPDGETQSVYGPQSREGHFFTGPPCAAQDQVAVELSSPEDGAEVYPGLNSTGWIPEFVWLDPLECLPDAYKIQFSLQERWINPDLEIDTETPANRWKADRMLEQGVEYFWRVASVVNGEVGPWSQPRSFTTLTLSENQPGLISGFVFEDNCNNPYPRDDYPEDYTPPEGCIIPSQEIDWSSDDRVIGDGLFTHRDSGIPGATISICTGVCPWQIGSECILDVTTNPDSPWRGDWYAYLPLGTYCVQIREEKPGNGIFDISEGYWTTPWTDGHDFSMYTIQITEPGQVIPDVNFGWDDHGVDFETYSFIRGSVWLDRDGIVDDFWEDPGLAVIDDVSVYLADGDCDVSWNTRVIDTRQANYGWNNFQFNDLEAGNYCLVMDPSSWDTAPNPIGPNEVINIDPGTIIDVPADQVREIGTADIIQVDHALLYAIDPTSESGDAMLPITITEGQALTGVRFRWVNWPLIVALENTSCLNGPSSGQGTVLELDSGDAAYLLGRMADNTWWQTSKECWVPDEKVAFHGDPGVLPVVEIPPTAVPVPPTKVPQPGDSKPPSVTASHNPTSPSQTDEVTIKANATDNRGVVRISIWTSRFPNIWPINPAKTCHNQNNCSLKAGPFDPADSLYYFARAWDAAGNQGQSSTGSFTIPH